MIKKAWQMLKDDWPTMTIYQKVGWLLFFWLLFPLLVSAVKYGNIIQDKYDERLCQYRAIKKGKKSGR